MGDRDGAMGFRMLQDFIMNMFVIEIIFELARNGHGAPPGYSIRRKKVSDTTNMDGKSLPPF
jgi:hypothetical protein